LAPNKCTFINFIEKVKYLQAHFFFLTTASREREREYIKETLGIMRTFSIHIRGEALKIDAFATVTVGTEDGDLAAGVVAILSHDGTGTGRGGGSESRRRAREGRSSRTRRKGKGCSERGNEKEERGAC
jgi:hypothetical protein